MPVTIPSNDHATVPRVGQPADIAGRGTAPEGPSEPSAAMAGPPPARGGAWRWRASPTFALCFGFDGRPYLSQDVEPYQQFWLSERERWLHAAFAGRRGSTVSAALAMCARVEAAAAGPVLQRRLAASVAEMQAAGVLVPIDQDTSRYDGTMVEAYLRERPFPHGLAGHIAQLARLGEGRRVLDLAGGPGDLALQLAATGAEVSVMDSSAGFLAAAAARAAAVNLPLATLHDSANRLPQHDGQYDLVTIAQALHWLDDVQVCRGLLRVLRPGGHVVVVHAAMDLPDDHPLAWLFGHDSVLGAKRRQSFADEVRPLAQRLTRLFEALDAPRVQRVLQVGPAAAEAIVPARMTWYRQPRPFDEGFARAFLTPAHLADHLAATGSTAQAFWARVRAACQSVPPERLTGTQHWALLHFRRGTPQPGRLRLRQATRPLEWLRSR